MPEARPAISEEMKRIVRQECCFGCVICGSPLFQYDHMVGYAEIPEHTVENLVLLCGQCHPDKTYGRISLDSVRKARSKPFNSGRLSTSGHRLTPNDSIKVLLGSNESVAALSNDNNIYHVLWVSGVGYFTIHYEDGALTFSMLITDARGRALLVVEKGEIKVTTQAWDYKYEGTTLKIRNGPGQILFEAKLSNHLVHVKCGAFLNARIDGFVVDNEMLVSFVEGGPAGWNMGTVIQGGSYGWGVANLKDISQEAVPRGFGSLRTVGNPPSPTR